MHAKSDTGSSLPIDPYDTLQFNESAKVCFSARHQKPVVWTSNKGSVAQGPGGRCCNELGLMAAYWFSLLQNHAVPAPPLPLAPQANGGAMTTVASSGTPPRSESRRRARPRKSTRPKYLEKLEKLRQREAARKQLQEARLDKKETEEFTEISSDAVYRPPGGGVF